MDIDREQFSDILKDYVSEKRKNNPKISESQIARNLGISNATFYRMINRHTRPTVRTLLTLCKSIPKMQEAVTEKMLEVTRESRTGRYVGEELERLLSDRSCFITYALALSERGVTAKEALYGLGFSGLKALETLTKKGFVKKDERNVCRAVEAGRGIVLSFDLIKKQVQILAEHYRPDNVANNYIYYKTESLNKKGRRELYEAHKELHRKVQEIMENKENKGDMPLFSAGFFDMFSITDPENKK